MSLKPSIFDFQVENHKNKKINLSDFSGKKAYVIVNVASA
jgi:glutathione peroxidase-family protein